MISDDDDDDDYDFDYDDVLTIEPFRCKKNANRYLTYFQNESKWWIRFKTHSKLSSIFFPTAQCWFQSPNSTELSPGLKVAETVGEQLTTDANVASLDQHLGGRNPAPPWMVEILYMYMYM